MPLLGWFALFTLCLTIYGAIAYIWWYMRNDASRKLVDTLATSVSAEGATTHTSVLMEDPGRPTGLAGLLSGAGGVPGIERLSANAFRLLTLVAAVVGFALGMKLIGFVGIPAPVIGAFALGIVPWAYRERLRGKRYGAMEEQFPDALDFLSRSVRAGNAFSIALELLAEEAAEPLKAEIGKVTREMALGSGLEDALRGLIDRVPLLEVRMFVAAVLLQRETGGNLSEVLNKLALSVRERVRLRGQVRVVTGQGRLTAKVLTFMPLFTMIALKVVNPGYLKALTDEPAGRNLLGIAIMMQIAGYLVMQRMLKVEV